MNPCQAAGPPDPSDFRCPICSYAGKTPVQYDFGEHKIHACPVCRLMFLHPQPTAGELKSLYSDNSYYRHDDFYEGDNRCIYGYADYFAERMNKQREYRSIAARCVELLRNNAEALPSSPRLLEVGCGPGFFLEEARNAGLNVQGIEFNPAVITEARERRGLDIRHRDYLSQPLPDAPYDAIVMLDVLEHLPDPFAGVRKAYDALAPGGLLVVSTVDSGSLTSRLLGKRLEDFRRVREHLYFFGRRNIRHYLRHCGFSVKRIQSIGHTFLLGHLMARIMLMLSVRWRVPGLFRRITDAIGNRTISFNPRTKMIVYAQKPTDRHTKMSAENVHNDLNAMQAYQGYYNYLMSRVGPYLTGKTVLEIGCGTGNALRALVEKGARRVIGVDRNARSMDRAREYLAAAGMGDRVDFAEMDLAGDLAAFKNLVREREVDAVFSFNFLEHLPDDMRLIRAVHDSLRPGGLFINVVPAGSLLYNGLDEAYLHLRRYDPHDTVLRFAPFTLIQRHRLGLIKSLGWMAAGKKAYKGIGQPLKIYNALFPADRLIDLACLNKTPLGASFVLVHRKDNG